MNILQVCSAESLGGGERHVIDLTRGLIERGHRLHLAVRPGSPLRAPLTAYPVTWHQLGLRNALDVISASHLAGIIRENAIDILHAHVARDYLFCGIAARMVGNVRYFLTRHHFNPIKSNPVYSWTIAEARALIAVSETVRSRLTTAFPQFSERIVVIPNWVTFATPTISRQEARSRLGITQRFAVGIVGQIARLKGQDLFVEAALSLLGEREWTEAEFVIVGAPGPDDDDFADRLQERIDQAGAGRRIRFAGFVDNAAALLPAFDVVAVLSHNEAFSLALVEAMAAGCAVVATRVGGMAEIVEDGLTGLFVEPDDESGLISALSRLLVDRPLRMELGSRASIAVRERFERGRVIDRIEALYISTGTRP